MNTRLYLVLGVLTVLSGLAGGALSERFFSASEALAARDFAMPDKPLTEIAVPRGGFLFKSNGRVVAKITGTGNGGALVLYGGDGDDKVRLAASRNGGGLIIRNGATSTDMGVNVTGADVFLSMKSNGRNNVRLESRRSAGSLRLVGGRARFMGRGYNIIHPSRAETAAGSGATRKSTVGTPARSGTGRTGAIRMPR